MQAVSKLVMYCFGLIVGFILCVGCEPQAQPRSSEIKSAEIPDLRIPVQDSVSTQIRVLLTPPAQFSISSKDKLVIESTSTKKMLTTTPVYRLDNIKLSATKRLVLGQMGIVELPIAIYSVNPTAQIELGGHRYLGKILLMNHPQQGLLVINQIDLESYVSSVVDSEMPISFGVEARKAQAILARTYALAHILEHRAYMPYDLTDSTRHQKYHGTAYLDSNNKWLSSMTKESQLIIEQTRNLICTHQNQPFVTYYCACCGGHTVDSDDVFPSQKPNVEGVPDPWCHAAPSLNWQVKIPRNKAIQEILRYLNLQQSTKQQPKIANFSGMSRVTPTVPDKQPQWLVRDGSQKFNITAVELRKCWLDTPIPSSNFQIQISDQEFTLNGHGSGHCVGLCQSGAKGMSQAGKSAAEIIHFYYGNIEIQDWKTLKLSLTP